MVLCLVTLTDLQTRRARLSASAELLVFVCNAPSRFARVGYNLNSYCVAVYGSIFIPFSPVLSEVIAFSESLDSSYFRR